MSPLNKKSFTLIELITTMSIIAIIAAVTSAILISLMQLIIYVPREAKTRSVAQELMDIMIEGDSNCRGMRYAVGVIDASSTQFTYTFGYPASTDRRNARFRLVAKPPPPTIKKIYRSSTGPGTLTSEPPTPDNGTEVAIPYYAAGRDISISAPGDVVFRYFNASGDPFTPATATFNQIRRVEITIIVTSGSGLFRGWQSSFRTTSSVDIRQ